jgi:hypothetical protein
MSTDFTKCQVSPKSGAVITAKGRLAYADGIYKKKLPMGETDQAKAKFSTSLLFPKGADLGLLKELVDKTCKDKWGADYKKKYGKIKIPFHPTEDHPKIGVDPEEFPVFIRTAATRKPEVVHANGKDCEDEEQIYSGRWALISVEAWTYDHKTGGKGVSLNLNNVLLLDHDDPIGSKRTTADADFAGIVTDDGEKPSSTDGLFD